MSLTFALKKSIALKQDIYGYMRVTGTPHELIAKSGPSRTLNPVQVEH